VIFKLLGPGHSLPSLSAKADQVTPIGRGYQIVVATRNLHDQSPFIFHTSRTVFTYKVLRTVPAFMLFETFRMRKQCSPLSLVGTHAAWPLKIGFLGLLSSFSILCGALCVIYLITVSAVVFYCSYNTTNVIRNDVELSTFSLALFLQLLYRYIPKWSPPQTPPISRPVRRHGSTSISVGIRVRSSLKRSTSGKIV
jgi:hypothetical protein